MSEEHDSWFKSAFGLDVDQSAGKVRGVSRVHFVQEPIDLAPHTKRSPGQ